MNQCQWCETHPTLPQCTLPATRKWGDCWFCEIHGAREKKKGKEGIVMVSIIEQLKLLKRYRHRSCEDDDGSVDEWDEEDSNGDYIQFCDVAKIIEQFESIKSASLEVDVMRGHITEEYAAEIEQLRAIASLFKS